MKRYLIFNEKLFIFNSYYTIETTYLSAILTFYNKYNFWLVEKLENFSEIILRWAFLTETKFSLQLKLFILLQKFKIPHRYWPYSLLQPSKLAFLSNSRWQTVNNVQINQQTTEIWPKDINVQWVSLWHQCNYREAKLLNSPITYIIFVKNDDFFQQCQSCLKLILIQLIQSNLVLYTNVCNFPCSLKRFKSIQNFHYRLLFCCEKHF